MEKDVFLNELNFIMTKKVLLDLLNKKILTEKEYKDFSLEIKEKYEPIFYLLFDK